jgi:transposase
VSNGVVHGYLRRARLAGLTWPLPEGMDDEVGTLRDLTERPRILDAGQAIECRLWVRPRKAHREQMFSALP